MASDNQPTHAIVIPDSLKQIALDEIRRRIFSREIKAGARIEQEPLAAEMGMSKIPVREALSALVTEGLVEVLPRRGAFVVPLSKKDILDHYWMLAHISGRAAELAVANMTDDALAELNSIASQLEQCSDETARSKLNFRFHSLINHAADSPRIATVLRMLGSPLPLDFYEANPELAAESDAEHRKILEAFARRSGPGARKAMERHFLRGAEQSIAMLEQQGFWDDEKG